MKLDLHVHTDHSSDGKNKVEDIIRILKEKGFGGAAILDHNSPDGAREALNMHPEDFIVVPSIEVSSKYGHILALNVTDPIKRDIAIRFFFVVSYWFSYRIARFCVPLPQSRDRRRPPGVRQGGARRAARRHSLPHRQRRPGAAKARLLGRRGIDGADPLTGEKVAGSMNIWTAETNRIAQSAADILRYISGELTAEGITNGDYVRNWVGAAQAASGGASPTLSKWDVARRHPRRAASIQSAGASTGNERPNRPGRIGVRQSGRLDDEPRVLGRRDVAVAGQGARHASSERAEPRSKRRS